MMFRHLILKLIAHLPIILESQKRKIKIIIFCQARLTYKNGSVYAEIREINFKNNKIEKVFNR